MSEIFVGQTISHYTIRGFMGKGGMGEVYRAMDTRLHREVALKFLPPDLLRDPQAKQRFMQEARTASALDHPNICTIHEIDETPEGRVFICMTSYTGETLEEKLQDGPLPLGEAVEIAVQVVKGLAEAHQHGIIHRDIKPGNILITQKGEVKILDFGLAKLSGGQQMTRAGALVGTPAYMAPEQHLARPVDLRTDIWAVGLLLYEMLAGKHPFMQPYEEATIYQIVQNNPEPVTLYNPGLPPAITDCIATCLQKDPTQRFPSMEALLERLIERNTAEPATSAKTHQLLFPHLLTSRFLGITGLVVVLGAIIIFLLRNTNPGLTPVLKSTAHEIPVKKNLIILPFNVIGHDATDQAFCDGLNEILVNRLTQLEQEFPTLLVIPSSEVLHQDIRTVEAARKRFGVNLALTGSFQRMGDTVQITQNLVDARSLRQVRASEITARLSNIFTLQDGLFSRTLDLLQIDQIVPASVGTAGSTTIPGAHEFYIQGRGYLLRYDNPEHIVTAIRLFEQAIQLDSTFALGYAALGEAYWRRYEVTKDVRWTTPALQYCSHALALNRELSPVYITLGFIYNGQGQYDQALQAIRTALNLAPHDPAALGLLATIYENQGKISQAETIYKEAVQHQPDYWARYNDLGIFYFNHGQLNEALHQFQQILRLTPDNYVGYRNTGVVYASQHLWEEAIRAFQHSLEIQPTYSACANIGTAYFYRQEYQQAIRYFHKALAMQDTDYRIWGFLADAYYWGTAAEPDTAKQYYHDAIRRAEVQLQINPNDQEILADLAGYYSMIQENDRAAALLATLEPMTITDVGIMARMAETYEMLHQRSRALYWIELAISHGYTLAKNQAVTSLKFLVQDKRYQQYLSTIK